MDLNWIIERLDVEWDTNGFFDLIRNGFYDAEQAQSILSTLRAIRIGQDECVPKRLVSMLWYLPSFLVWQTERVAEAGGDRVSYERFISDVYNTLEDVLSTP
jgi:hypothetical protein